MHTTRIAAAITAIAASNALAQRATPTGDEFSIIALPDTQNYVRNGAFPQNFNAQTQWIRDRILSSGNPDNIVFVTHLGDVVSNGDNRAEYMLADTAMSFIEGPDDGVVPYGILPGNHDFASTGNKSTGSDLFVEFFGPTRFAGRTWYEGADPSGNNSYQVFTTPMGDFMHISLEWRPDQNVTNGPTRDPSPLDWAQSVISANPGMPTIVSSHEHLDDDPAGRSGSGENVWQRLVAPNDQVIMILNGHYHSAADLFNDGEFHQVSLNNFNEPVIEALQDFQDYPGGGQGWLRIITFDPDAGQIQFQTYSPVLDQFQTERPEDPGIGGRASEFEIAIDFATRFQFAEPAQPPLNPFQTLRFRDGSNGYNGTRDTEVRQDDPDTNLGAAPEVTIDADDDGAPGLQRTQGLIRFDNFIGAAGQRVRPGDFIGSAIINFNVNNPGSGFDVHEVTQNWAPNFTWNRFGNGLNPGVDVAPTPEYRLGLDNGNSNIPTGPLEIYVTQMVQRWADGRGQPFGTAFLSLPAGTNGLDLDSSESASPPELVVTTLLPKFRAVRFTQSVDGYNGAIDTQLTQSEPNTSGAGFTSFSADASDSGGQNHILIRFDDIFGTGPDRVGPFDVIAKAYITLTADDPGDGASAFRLLQPFTAGATWNNSFGGDGVQADNIEAVAMPAGGAAGAFGLGEIDVTESIVAWLQGATNHGWALLPSGTNGWDVASSESGPQLRPSLTVIIDRCVADLVEPFDAQPDGNDLLELIDRVDGGLASGDWNADSETDIFDVIDYLAEAAIGCP